MRSFIRSAVTILLATAVAGTLSQGAVRAGQPGADQGAKSGGKSLPNIVVLFTDDQGYGDVGCFGAKGFKTPNLDQMAREGTRFTSFYVAQPVCTASRASLMTGCYANRVGLQGALNHQSNIGISPEELILPEILKAKGYATAMFGKWHLGHRDVFSPLKHGFDEFLGIPYSNDNGPLHPIVRGIPPLPMIDGDQVVETDPDQSLFTRRFTERAVQFIEKNKDRPFFLYVPHVMPHVPIFASDGFRGKSELGLYGDVIEELDWGIGEVLKAIERLELDERTLVIFCSDNGPFLSYGEHAGSAGPLREGKLTAFEGGVRVPCIMRWPGKIPAGRTCEELCSTIDLLPTVAKLVGGPQPERKIDGQDIWPLLAGEHGAKGRETFFYYVGDELHAVRAGDWKLHLRHDYLTSYEPRGKGGKPANIENLKPESMQMSGVRGIASRHGYQIKQLDLSLFNLDDDLGETTNVADRHPEVVQRLLALAEAARADLGDSLVQRQGAGVRPSGRWEPGRE
jgi:arylsulfatase A-like enzyme